MLRGAKALALNRYRIDFQRKIMNKNQIIKIYGTEYKEMTEELLEYIKAEALIPEKDTFIGIKPNLVSPSTADQGGTTHPEIVAGIIEYLKQHGFTNIIMLEGSWVGDKTSTAYELCGYRELSEKYDIPFYDLQKEKASVTDCSGFDIEICDIAKKVEFLINVPVLKGHCQTHVTCALKNLKGLLSNREKRHFHACGLHMPIAHLNAYMHQDLIIIDNICGDLDFEDGGNPVTRNCIMAALDPVLADTYGCSLLHTEAEEVPYIGMAEALGAGSSDLSTADIRTIRETEEWHDDNLLPYSDKVVSLQEMVDSVDSCSACYGYLIPALQMLKEDGLFDKLDKKIGIGQGYRGKKGKLGVGNCTAGFDYCIRGCPPTENQIYEGLKEYIKTK